MVKNIRRLLFSFAVIFGLLAPYDHPLKVHAQTNNIIHYKIKKGDTFYLLGLRFNSSVKSISNMNPEMNLNNLIIGRKIKVPVGSGIKLHHVKKGDTLGNISWKYDSTVEFISSKNNIVNPNLIYPEDILSIPEITRTEINAILNDINKASIEKGGFGNARYENGWIKIDMDLNYVASQYYMKIVNQILDNHNVKQVDYTVENVVWDCPPGVHCTGHHGTVCIKVDKK
ncbi:LysM peptidoglycan-binding domain-containing protein [Neobacillus drentensis]|uniref:LysM peptidoglycan-binding domain-containing protein n=1 Tax=Neobacillus drentensis TaxID=220684 RepID=UPI002FFE9DDA